MGPEATNHVQSQAVEGSRPWDHTCKGPVVRTSVALEEQKGKASVAEAGQIRRRHIRDEI